MRIDLEYIAKILDVFLESEKAHVELPELEENGIALKGEPGFFDEKLVFHMQIAIDNELIGTKSGLARNIKEIGMHQSIDGMGSIISIPIRLTQKGHDFACALNNKEVLQKLKTEFKDAPFKVIFEGGQKLIEHFMKKKLDEILE
ncbi:conserved hypothetical protein [Teredinibacter turnerae T7901]|uniref:DUF2513 domain-containing protein n=1 Tax=Teredinibacter turnerae (strain ATCC 39867 / T7901) TaxID=377629 RepID=C5BHT2_TERTT|nr:DUF2513 domain-containing protein [Teredinibacter turnerae]ACR12886.1 conserved hypothetical protein [Teredinibacter turnerae T7901]